MSCLSPIVVPFAGKMPQAMTGSYGEENIGMLIVSKNGMKTTKNEGVKNDSGKVRLDLIPPEVIFALGDILTKGAEKYEERNWEKGMKWGRVYGALMRHLWTWWSGDNLDKETGKSHLWHAACCIAFLITYEERKIGEDDRKKNAK